MVRVCPILGARRLHARLPNADFRVLVFALVKKPIFPRRLAFLLPLLICQEGEGISVTRTVM
jgi:hypothetical protein